MVVRLGFFGAYLSVILFSYDYLDGGFFTRVKTPLFKMQAALSARTFLTLCCIYLAFQRGGGSSWRFILCGSSIQN